MRSTNMIASANKQISRTRYGLFFKLLISLKTSMSGRVKRSSRVKKIMVITPAIATLSGNSIVYYADKPIVYLQTQRTALPTVSLAL